jgi:hypothetical protein
MMALLSFLNLRVPAALVLLLAALLVWQSVRIEGLPLLGGGLKAQIVQLEKMRDAHALADAQDATARLMAQRARDDHARRHAQDHLAMERATQTQIQTVIREVPVYVSAASDAKCVLPWGAVRLLDAAASGADPTQLRDHVAPGQPDDAASDVELSEMVALLAANLGTARRNADQLMHLQRALTPQ